MKHETINPPAETTVTAEVYYYNKWKSNAHGGIIAVALMTACAVWSMVAGMFYSSPAWCIGLACAAVFFAFVAVTRFRDGEYYYDRYLSAAADPSIINTEHVAE